MSGLRSLLIAVAVAGATLVAQAQSRTSDALIALAHEDYDRAAAILKPIAESDVTTDHAAQFLLATLYENGHGVPLDALRACALYHRASIESDSLFGAEAQRLMRALFLAHGNEWYADCQALANLGFDHRFEPVTFDLGPGHTITWTFTGATVTYQGRTKQVPWRLGSRGAAYLPLRHTALQTAGSRTTRHFVEIFVWQPSGAKWDLNWHLFEVIRDDVRHVADTPALLTRNDRPPAGDVPDLQSLVTLRTNAAGMAEWSILTERQGSGTIESEEERRARSDEEAARNAALSRVDWSRTFEVFRAPSLRYGMSDGCGHVQLYAWADERAEAILVTVDKTALALTTAARTIDIARERARVSVNVHVYDRPMRNSPFCTDVGMAATEEIWSAVSGRLTIELSSPGVTARHPAQYRATIRIDGAEFVSRSGQRVRQQAPIVLTALAGLMWG